MKNFVIVLFTSVAVTLSVESLALQDSTASDAKLKRGSIKLTVRMNSIGFFAYGGRIACDNPAIDVNFTFERKRIGFLFFKAFDLYDRHSSNNFILTTVFTNIRASERLTITPHLGFFIEQNLHFIGEGSDLGSITVTNYKLTRNFRVEHTLMIPHLLLRPEKRDCLNRFRLVYSSEHFESTFFAWHNNNIFDTSAYWSSGLNLSYARIQVTERVQLSTGVTGLLMLNTSDSENIPRKNGIVFTIAAAVQ